MDAPVAREAGLSAASERRWGLIGGVVGSVAGIGAAVVAVGIDGAPLYETEVFPSVFRRGEVLGIDLYLLTMLLAGVGFSTASLVLARRSPFPRTEAYGAGLVGLILTALAGSILFLRVMSLVAT